MTPKPDRTPVTADFLLRHYLAATAHQFAVILHLSDASLEVRDYAYSLLEEGWAEHMDSVPDWGVFTFDSEEGAVEFCNTIPDGAPYAAVWARMRPKAWDDEWHEGLPAGDPLGYWIHENS